MNRDRRSEQSIDAQAEPASLRSVLASLFKRYRMVLASERGLIGWAALEASLPMLPVEFVLIPLTRMRPSAAGHLVVLATVFSGVGAIYSYALGSNGESILHWNGLHTAGPGFDYLINGIDRWGEGLVLLAAFLPAPLSIVSIGAGMLHIGLIPFLLTVIFARSLRFYLVTSATVYFHIRKQNVNTKS